jgi:peptide deformylase
MGWGKTKGEVEEPEREVEREERRRFLLAHVRQYPDAVLRSEANAVEEYDTALHSLVQRMVGVMQAGHGIGLAAPQVGVLQRVLVYQASEDSEPVALVNPEIVERSDETEVMEEGCLSLGAAGVTVDVERAVFVRVEARDVAGEQLSIDADGLEARVIQHEVDHLDGVLVIDRTTPDQRREALAKLRPQPVLDPLA